MAFDRGGSPAGPNAVEAAEEAKKRSPEPGTTGSGGNSDTINGQKKHVSPTGNVTPAANLDGQDGA